VALTLQQRIYLPILAVAGGFFFVGVLFLTLLKKHLKKPNLGDASENRRRALKKSAMTSLWLSVSFALASAVALTQTDGALQFVTSNKMGAPLELTAGVAAEVLQWATLSVSILFLLGVTKIFENPQEIVRSAGSGDVESQVAGLIPPPPPPPPLPGIGNASSHPPGW
jgi:hypothetical protein